MALALESRDLTEQRSDGRVLKTELARFPRRSSRHFPAREK
jgi:hypothetical protein